MYSETNNVLDKHIPNHCDVGELYNTGNERNNDANNNENRFDDRSFVTDKRYDCEYRDDSNNNDNDSRSNYLCDDVSRGLKTQSTKRSKRTSDNDRRGSRSTAKKRDCYRQTWLNCPWNAHRETMLVRIGTSFLNESNETNANAIIARRSGLFDPIERDSHTIRCSSTTARTVAAGATATATVTENNDIDGGNDNVCSGGFDYRYDVTANCDDNDVSDGDIDSARIVRMSRRVRNDFLIQNNDESNVACDNGNDCDVRSTARSTWIARSNECSCVVTGCYDSRRCKLDSQRIY